MGRVLIPFWDVQHDFATDLRAKKGTFWLSYRENGAAETAHKDVTVNGASLECDGVTVSRVDDRAIRVSGPPGAATLTSPLKEYSSTFAQEIYSLDISPDGLLGVGSSQEGVVSVFLTGDGVVQRRLQGHFGDVFTSRFFPSGEVVLTGGADLRLRIWSVADGSCPVTLLGHSGGILDTAIVDRGRNILSASRDGTARLWDCGTSQCIGVVADLSSSINALALVTAPAFCTEPTTPTHEREVGTAGKVALLATEDGRAVCADVRAKQPCITMSHTRRAAFNTCCFLNENSVLAGAQDGAIMHFDLRQPESAVNEYWRNESAVLSVRPGKVSSSFVACNASGSCFKYDMSSAAVEYLTGPFSGSVNRVVVHNGRIYTAGKDKNIRIYSDN